MKECLKNLKTADQFESCKLWYEAESEYIKACERLEKFFHHWHSDELIIQTTIETYHKLADVLRRQGRVTDAISVCQKINLMVLSSLEKPIYSKIRLRALIKASELTQLQLQRLESLWRKSA